MLTCLMTPGSDVPPHTRTTVRLAALAEARADRNHQLPVRLSNLIECETETGSAPCPQSFDCKSSKQVGAQGIS
jgi:hypothetical protein